MYLIRSYCSLTMYIQWNTFNTVDFEWDDSKNRRNYKKHGIWFEEAQTIWADIASIEFYDPEHSEREDRFIRIGLSTLPRLLLAVFCKKCYDQGTKTI